MTSHEHHPRFNEILGCNWHAKVQNAKYCIKSKKNLGGKAEHQHIHA
jgi:hypothetical protein